MSTSFAIVGVCCLLAGIVVMIRGRRRAFRLIERVLVFGGVLLIIFGGLSAFYHREIVGMEIHVTVNPSGTRIYVPFGPTSSGFDYMSVIDSASNRVIRNLRVPDDGSPRIDLSGNRLYLKRDFTVGCDVQFSPQPGWFIDMRTDRVVYVPPGPEKVPILLEGCIISPSGDRAYASEGATQSMLDPHLLSYQSRRGVINIIDMTTHKIEAEISIGGPEHFPTALAMNRQGTRVYVSVTGRDNSNSFVSNIFVIDTTTNKVAAVIRGGYRDMAVNAGGTLLYAVGPGTVDVIDTVIKRRVATVRICPPLQFWVCW